MRDKLLKLLVALLALALLLSCLPTVATRVKNERANQNVVVSLLYNDLRNRLSSKETDQALEDYQKIGVQTISVMEEDLNQMTSRGYVTSISYASLLHKYDEESMDLAKRLEGNESIRFNSYCIITKREEAKQFLDHWVPLKYSPDEYCKVTDEAYGATLYCLYNGSDAAYNLVFGYNEADLQRVKDAGYDICLIFKLKDYQTDAYMSELERLIRTYPVKYINLKSDGNVPEDMAEAAKHFEGLSRLISQYDLTLVVTENPDQLGNQQPFGYATIFNENAAHVMRAYETYDASHADATGYVFRYYQYLNSTLDRNIRFITVTQLLDPGKDEAVLNQKTLKATKMYIDEIQKIGYTVNGERVTFDYPELGRWVNAVAAALMVLMLLVMLEILADRFMPRMTVAAMVVALLGMGATKFVVPQRLVSLYSTVWAVILPCFAITVTFWFYKKFEKRMPMICMMVSAIGVMAGIMMLGGLVQIAELSGISYYMNNIFFRGIKLSLFLPLLYGLIAFYFVFYRQERNLYADIKQAITARIQVYWVILAVGFAGMAFYYLLRSGNVNSIGLVEQLMRTKITDMFIERPRTKEFLIGYPALMLFVFYMKKGHRPLGWLFAVGSSILAASISNTFCHVFTNAGTIYMRVANGLIIGLFVCILVYFVNLAVYHGIRRLVKEIDKRAKD